MPSSVVTGLVELTRRTVYDSVPVGLQSQDRCVDNPSERRSITFQENACAARKACPQIATCGEAAYLLKVCGRIRWTRTKQYSVRKKCGTSSPTPCWGERTELFPDLLDHRAYASPSGLVNLGSCRIFLPHLADEPPMSVYTQVHKRRAASEVRMFLRRQTLNSADHNEYRHCHGSLKQRPSRPIFSSRQRPNPGDAS